MPASKVVDKVRGKRVVIDQCVTFPTIEKALSHAGIPWRRFDPRASDKYIRANMEPDEILLTRDMEFFTILGPEKAVLLPINMGHKKRTWRLNKKRAAEIEQLEKRGVIKFRIMRGMRMLFARENGHEWEMI